jgi:peptidylprolyl isomerase
VSLLRASRLALCCAAATFVLAGCGGSDSSSSSSGTTPTSAQTTAQRTPPKPIANPFKRPPLPGPHPHAHVQSLIIRDVVKGKGAELEAGDKGVFDFIGANYVTGKPLDSAWGRKRPFEIAIDHGVVIDGWWQGVPGMRVGGRRVIIVPPTLGFTTNPDPVLANATTYFDIVLRAVVPAQPAGVGGSTTATGATPTG